MTALYSQSQPPNRYVLPLVWSPLDVVSSALSEPAASTTRSRFGHPTISPSTPPTTGTPCSTLTPYIPRNARMTPGVLTAVIGSVALSFLVFIFIVALIQDPTRRKHKRKQQQLSPTITTSTSSTINPDNASNWSTDSDTFVSSEFHTQQVPHRDGLCTPLSLSTRTLPPTAREPTIPADHTSAHEYELGYFNCSLPPTPNNSLAQTSSNDSGIVLYDICV